MWMTTRKTGFVRMVVATTLALGLTGVAATATHAVAAGGTKPFKVLLVEVSAEGQPMPEVPASADAAVKALNQSGVKIQLDVCEVIGQDPSDFMKCVRQAIDNKDAAYVGSAPDDGITLLADAKIPMFTPLGVTAKSNTDPISFPTTGGLPVLFGAEGAALVASGRKKLGIVHLDLASSKPIEDLARQATIGAGGKFVTDIIVTFQSVDVSAQVQQLKSSGANGVLIIATESVDAAFIRTMTQFGLGNVLIGVADGTMRQETLDSLGTQAKNVVAGASLPHVNVKGKNSPAMAQYVKDMKAAGVFTADNTRSNGVATWLDLYAVAAGARAVSGAITGPGLLATLNASKGLDLPVVGKWVPSANGPIADSPRLSVGTGFYIRYAGGGAWKSLPPADGADIFALIQKGSAKAAKQ
jgi:ABC-type branched-subunit amino acid transport system substrate-binding protein